MGGTDCRPPLTGETMEVLQIDGGLERRQTSFSFEGKDYILNEPDEAAEVRFRLQQVKSSKLVDGKVVLELSERVRESQTQFVADCLSAGDGTPVKDFADLKDKDGKPIKDVLSLVRSWPSRLTAKLFEKAKEMGDMDRPDTAKNSGSAMTDTSV